jgi:acetyl-CoA decarbonylase/synthase complex subunit gamma
MALTGIEIFKLLPKTNCGECGVPTCLAFAMSLATGKTELTKCPHVSEEAKSKLSEASAPPILPVTIGVGDKALKVGGDTVMFRHEKRFENPPGLAILISDKMADSEVDARLKKVKDLTYERVGLTLSANMVALKAETGDAAKFAALAGKVKASSDANIILMSEKTDVLAAGLKACADRKPLLYAATKDNADAVAALAKESGCAVAAKAAGMEELAALTEKLTAAGLKNIVIDSGSRAVRKALEDQIIIRSAALDRKSVV